MKACKQFLNRNRWFAVLLAAQLILIAVFVAGLFGKPYVLQLSPADFENQFTEVAALNEDGTALQIYNQTNFATYDGSPLTFSSAVQALPSGAYEVTVSYFSCQTPDAPTFSVLNSAGTLDITSAGNPANLRFDTLTLDDCHRSATTRLWVGVGANVHDMTATLTYNQGQLYLYGISLKEQPIYRVTRLVCLLLLLAAADFVLWLLFAKVDEKGAALRRKLRLPLLLAGIALFASLPVFNVNLYDGHDIAYHLQRIAAMAHELGYGQFPVRMATESMNGYSYANPLCYCELFLLLPALLYNAWLPLRTAYQVYVFVITLAATVIAWYSFEKITGSRRIGLLGSLLYTMSSYRLVCVYFRAAVGEYTALTFLPLVLLGLYGIYTKEKPRFADWAPMAFGMAGLIHSHLLSCELAVFLLILFCLLRLRETLRPARFFAWCKAAVLAALLSAWYLEPLLETMQQHLMINCDMVGKIQRDGLYPVQLFSPFGSGFGASSHGTTNDMSLTFGLPLILGFGLVVYCLIRREKWQAQKTLHTMKLSFAFALLCVVLASRWFPWDSAEGALGFFGGKLAGMFQYPWRFMSFISVLLCLAVLLAVKVLHRQNPRAAYAAAAAMAAGCLLMTGVTLTQVTTMGESSYNDYVLTDPYKAVGMGEYMPEGSSIYESIWAQPKPGSETLHLVQYEKAHGIAYLSVQNEGDAADISVPIYHYDNYRAVDEAGTEFAMTTGANNRIVLTIPAQYTGTIQIYYDAPARWRLFEILSLAAVIGCAGYAVYNRKKRAVRA